VVSPGSCPRCSRALPAESFGKLCPVCQSASETSQPSPGTPNSAAPPPEPETASFRPPEPVNPITVTDPFAVGLPELETQSAVTAQNGPAVVTTTGPDADSRIELPAAPQGYELIRRLGGGGMGDVFLAQEQIPERKVAIKFLRATGNPVALERFLSEVRALARVDHPHIVRFLATDFYRTQPFFTMEYARGGSLADQVSANGPLAPQEAARLIAAAARAVHAAHAAHILHRDLKPSNILLAADGTPRVSDFGLAKLTDQEGSATGTGPLGTPGFMPPEQVSPRRREIGPAADVYGLGATLYYLLTERPPFTGETQAEIVTHVERDLPERPRSVRPEIPLQLEAIVLKCLEKDPIARYASTLALAEDLEDFLAGRPTQAPVLTRLRRAKRWLLRNWKGIGTAIGAVTLAVVLVAVGRHFRDDPPTPPSPVQQIRDEIALGKTVRLLGHDGRPRSATWPLGPVELNSSADDGGTCNFESRENRVLILLDDPGVDSYRVRAEICQALKVGHVAPGATPDADEVGLVLGYAGQDGPNGNRVHSMMVLKFTEYDPTDGPQIRRWLELIDIGGAGAPGFAPRSFQILRKVDGSLLERANVIGRVWRQVEATVSPAGVWVPGQVGKFQLAASDGIAQRRKTVEQKLAAGPAGPISPFPEWSPRMPFGIWSAGSWVYVRNVTIEMVK
jgi:serine/threonine protein kinase